MKKQVKIWGDFDGSGRDKISFVYIERAHPFREEEPVDKFNNHKSVLLVNQTDYVCKYKNTHSWNLNISTWNDSDFAKMFQKA